MNHFIWSPFTSHSGLRLDWKIECDALSDSDLECLARAAIGMLERIDWPRNRFVGVPRGGLRFAEALNSLSDGDDGSEPIVVDDVYTTGTSVREAMEKHGAKRALVIYARGIIGSDVLALFQANYYLDPIIR